MIGVCIPWQEEEINGIAPEIFLAGLGDIYWQSHRPDNHLEMESFLPSYYTIGILPSEPIVDDRMILVGNEPESIMQGWTQPHTFALALNNVAHNYRLLSWPGTIMSYGSGMKWVEELNTHTGHRPTVWNFHCHGMLNGDHFRSWWGEFKNTWLKQHGERRQVFFSEVAGWPYAGYDQHSLLSALFETVRTDDTLLGFLWFSARHLNPATPGNEFRWSWLYDLDMQLTDLGKKYKELLDGYNVYLPWVGS